MPTTNPPPTPTTPICIYVSCHVVPRSLIQYDVCFVPSSVDVTSCSTKMFVHPVHLCSCGYGGFRFDAVLLNSLEPSFPIALTSPRAPDKTAIPFITLCITNELARATARPCACWRSPGSIPVSTPLALADALAAKVATEGSAGHDWRATQYIEIAFGGTASPHVHRPSPL